MTEWTRQLQPDDDDDDNNQVFRIIIIIVQIFLLVAVGCCCFFTICGRKFSDRFFVIATTPIVDGRRLTTEEARVYEYERRRQKELSKDIEDPEIRKKRLTTYFHRYQCRMVSEKTLPFVQSDHTKTHIHLPLQPYDLLNGHYQMSL
jgi:hypothetical protein